jgi:transcriptional repressor NrdR
LRETGKRVAVGPFASEKPQNLRKNRVFLGMKHDEETDSPIPLGEEPIFPLPCTTTGGSLRLDFHKSWWSLRQDAMKCPKCGQLNDKVVDSREIREGEVIRRRRLCIACQHRFTTYEEVLRQGLRVIKRNGQVVDFDRKKLLIGIKKSCEKRPVTDDQIQAVVEAIAKECEAEFEKEIPSTVVGQKVMQHLERLDEVAYVRFASVYRRYRDVNQFLSEVESLIGRE